MREKSNGMRGREGKQDGEKGNKRWRMRIEERENENRLTIERGGTKEGEGVWNRRVGMVTSQNVNVRERNCNK